MNQTLANHYFPKSDAIGHSVAIGIDSVKGPWQIVGIARDTLSGGPHNSGAGPMTYIPLAQIEPFNPPDPAAPKTAPAAPEENQDRFASNIEIRTITNPKNTIADLRQTLAAIDPNLPIIRIQTVEQQVDSMISREALIATLTGIFSLLALTLAAIGLYGVMSYSVILRTSEIGIRLALGAQTRSILWMVLRESILLLAIGLALGLPLSLALTRLIRQQLFGLSPVDPTTFATSIAVVSTISLLAARLSARRATTVDPMIALRCE